MGGEPIIGHNGGGAQRGASLNFLKVPNEDAVRKSQDTSAWPSAGDQPEQVAGNLRSSPSREEGYALLEKHCPTKASLQNLARHLDLHILRDDDATMIRDKIVEAAIGFRLRFNAVRSATSVTES